MDGTTLDYRADTSFTAEEDARLRRLLFACFPHEPRFVVQRHLKERPAHRWLVRDAAGEFVAHAAVHEKTIGSEEGDLCIGGVAEVCVAASFRGRGLAKEMLRAIGEWLPARGMPFALLFGKPSVYASSGYALVKNELRLESSLLRRCNPWRGKPMFKCLAGVSWPKGVIDLRGSAF